MTDTPTPPDGWYPDPAGSGGTRRWDGIAWTDEVRPAGEEQRDAGSVDATDAGATAHPAAGEAPDGFADPASAPGAAAPASGAEAASAPASASVPGTDAAPIRTEAPAPRAEAAPAPAEAAPAPAYGAAPVSAPASPPGYPAYSTAPGYTGAPAAGYGGGAPGYAGASAAGYAGASAPAYGGGTPGYTAPGTRAAAPANPGVSTDTVWVWLIVALPIVQLLVLFLFDWRSLIEQSLATAFLSGQGGTTSSVVGLSLQSTFLSLGVSLISLVISGLSVLFAFLDWRQLRARGIQKPFHWAWAFFVFVVSAGVYVIGRGIVLRRQTGKGLGPIWGFIAVSVVSIVAAAIWAILLMRDFSALFEQYMYYYYGY